MELSQFKKSAFNCRILQLVPILLINDETSSYTITLCVTNSLLSFILVFNC